ncbi:MAG: glycerol-3-phosphate 1-O-acyltransferase PlsY [Planctomycetota bacterium]|nr:glycerol-3-phosphate 1-O-acyltransferase PlsY [Planctomycetota bacterium]MDG2144655.1 glycerol-3-phosphate 1-O-acyltransferase PlsY [Planctomycetota bacterium]
MILCSLPMPTGAEWGVLLASYLVGSIPFGYVMARLKGVNLHATGSGNIGATNTSRAIGKPLGLLAFTLDFLKGYVPAVFLVPALASGEAAGMGAGALAVLAGAASTCGHVWPIYLRFKGGKAVATGCGALVAVAPTVFLLGGVGFLITAFSTGFVSLASMVMVALFPIIAFQDVSADTYGMEVVWGCIGFAVLVIWRHKENLKRLLSGLEPSIKKRNKS